MIKLFDDEILYKTMERNARKVSFGEYSWRHDKNRLLDIYRSLLN